MSTLRELIRQQAELREEEKALKLEAKNLNAEITTKESKGEEAGEEGTKLEGLIAQIKDVSTKLSAVASGLERLSRIEADEEESDTPPGADEDNEKNMSFISTKGHSPMNADSFGNGPGNGNFNINTRGKQVEPIKSDFERVIWSQMAKHVAMGQDKDFAMDKREACEWANKHFAGSGIAERMSKDARVTRSRSAMETKSNALDTTTPIIFQNVDLDPVPLLYAEIPLLATLPRQQVSNGQLTVPRITSAPSVYYVNEQMQAPVTKQTYDRLQTQWAEYQGISSVTKELYYQSPLKAAANLAEGLAKRAGQFMQTEIIYGAGQTLSGGTVRINGMIVSGAQSLYGTVSNVGGTINVTTVNNDFGRMQVNLIDYCIEPENVHHFTTKGVDMFLASAANDFRQFFPTYGSTREINGFKVISSQQVGNQGTFVTSLGQTLTGALIMTYEPKYNVVYDFGMLNFSTTDSASWVDNGTQVNAWAQRLIGMQIGGSFNYLNHQPNSVNVFFDGGAWSLSNASGRDYLVPPSVPYTPAASGAKSSS